MTRIDHVAIEVSDFDRLLDSLTTACALRVLRWGKRDSTGERIVLLGDGTGFKLELIESSKGTALAHLALEVDDADAAFDELTERGWESRRPPHDLPDAKARTALLADAGLAVQVITYDPGSPDLVRWQPATANHEP